MKTKHPKRASDDEVIEATAAAWLAQRDDSFSGDQGTAFALWCAADPRHAAAVARLEAAWGALRQLRDFRPEARVHPDRDLLARPRRAPLLKFPALAGVAACAAGLALAAVFWWHRPDGEGQTQTHVTAAGGYERVTLEDGSTVELNAGSEVRVRYTPQERNVQLIRGEAHFTVTKNPARPFRVAAGAIAVRAVGTAFDVRLDAREVAVLVTEGKVEIENSSRTQSVPTSVVPVLLVGERARMPLAMVVVPLPAPASVALPQVVVEKVAPEAMHEALAWQEPRLTFVETPLGEAVAQFNRHNLVQLVVGDAALEGVPVGGSFRADNVEAFVRLLERDPDIVSDRSDPTRIVLRRAR